MARLSSIVQRGWEGRFVSKLSVGISNLSIYICDSRPFFPGSADLYCNNIAGHIGKFKSKHIQLKSAQLAGTLCIHRAPKSVFIPFATNNLTMKKKTAISSNMN